MADGLDRQRPLTFSEAREEWKRKHAEPYAAAAIVGCLQHSSLTWWHDPRTGRSVAVVENVSQWPRIEQVIHTTTLALETGPFDSLSVFNQAAVTFRREVEQRYGNLT